VRNTIEKLGVLKFHIFPNIALCNFQNTTNGLSVTCSNFYTSIRLVAECSAVPNNAISFLKQLLKNAVQNLYRTVFR